MRCNVFLKFLAGLFVLCLGWAQAVALPAATLPPVPATVDSITATELRMYLEFLASDELGGRYTLSPSFGIAARYLASHLKAYGFHGVGEHGDFLQSFNIASSRPDTAKSSLALTLKGQSASYSYGDFYLWGTAEGEVQGQIVFVGYGISSAAQKHDDYAGLDVKGKIVLMVSLGNNPQGVDVSKLQDTENGLGAARAHGAASALQIPTGRFADLMRDKSFKERMAGRESIRLARDSRNSIPTAILDPELADKILVPLGTSFTALSETVKKHEPLAPKAMDASAHFVAAFQQTLTATQNVVGILDGSDRQLKNEYVVFSAHYDHLKTGPKGEIYPGADDDGSGTSAILAIAHAMSMDPPKRPVMVIFHAGEELGLLGSEYNTDVAPAVPLDDVVVDLNIDMIGRSKPPGDTEKQDEHLTDPNTVYLVGSNRISNELHKLSEDTNAEFQKLNLDYHYNDPQNPERIYFRSDHWNYAKHGIPIIFYFDGTHVDYHKPTDTVDKIDFKKMTQITRLVFETGWRIANLDHRLSKQN